MAKEFYLRVVTTMHLTLSCTVVHDEDLIHAKHVVFLCAA